LLLANHGWQSLGSTRFRHWGGFSKVAIRESDFFIAVIRSEKINGVARRPRNATAFQALK
jgi:hypothetical protein